MGSKARAVVTDERFRLEEDESGDQMMNEESQQQSEQQSADSQEDPDNMDPETQ